MQLLLHNLINPPYDRVSFHQEWSNDPINEPQQVLNISTFIA